MSAGHLDARHGRLFGVGVGPGDPELITRKAARLIAAADVVAYHAGTHRTSMARAIADDLVRAGTIEEELRYPVTTGAVDHPAGYHGWLAEFYEECAQRLAVHLSAGRDVVVLAEGDPMFYGSFMYLHDRLSDRFPTEVVPGVTSLSGATAVAAQTLSRHEDVLTVLPGTLPVAELARRLADTDAAVVMKLGRTFAAVREALRQAGVLDRAVYVERATGAGQRVMAVSDVTAETVPYMSIVVVPGRDRRADSAGRAAGQPVGSVPAVGPVGSTVGGTMGTVHVVGLGPAGDQWLTPQARSVLDGVRHLVGYGPYVERVPQREGLTRHASGNTVEVQRAKLALYLALGGEDVAVVSGGDAGIFGMASAVFEAAEDPRYAAVDIQVHPGVTAASAAAALAGAPLGADWAAVSLSDRLKPWAAIESRLRHVAEADLVLALYNPRSRSRPGLLGRAREVLLQARPAETVVAVARDVGRPGQRLDVTTLGGLDPEQVDMGCLVVIGSTATRVNAAGRVWTPRFVDRPLPV